MQKVVNVCGEARERERGEGVYSGFENEEVSHVFAYSLSLCVGNRKTHYLFFINFFTF